MKKTKADVILHDLDNPGPQRFPTLREALLHASTNQVSGYIRLVDETSPEPQIINLRKGKRKGASGGWVTIQ